MEEKIQKGIKDIKYIMELSEQQERIIKLVLKEAYINGQISGIQKLVEPMTEEQLIERERVSDSVTSKDSAIL